MRSMDDPRWLRLITIGLVLAALAVGYFLVSGRFAANKSAKPQAQVNMQVQQTATPQPSPVTSPTPSPAPQALGSATQQNGQKGSVQVLPRTGFPLALVGIFSASAMIAGWGLRKFPN